MCAHCNHVVWENGCKACGSAVQNMEFYGARMIRFAKNRVNRILDSSPGRPLSTLPLSPLSEPGSRRTTAKTDNP